MKPKLLIVYEKPFGRAANFLREELVALYKIEITIMSSEMYFSKREYIYSKNDKMHNNIEINKKIISQSTPVIFISMNYNKFQDCIDKLSANKRYFDIDPAYKEIADYFYEDDGIAIGKIYNRYIISVNDFPRDLKEFENKVYEMKKVINSNKKLDNRNIFIKVIEDLVIAVGLGLPSLLLKQIIMNSVKRKGFEELQSLMAVYDAVYETNRQLDDWIKEYCDGPEEIRIEKDYIYIIHEGNKWIHQARKLSFLIYFQEEINSIVLDYKYYNINKSVLPSSTKIFVGSYENKDFKKDVLVDKKLEVTLYENNTEKSKIIKLNEKYLLLGKNNISKNMIDFLGNYLKEKLGDRSGHKLS